MPFAVSEVTTLIRLSLAISRFMLKNFLINVLICSLSRRSIL
jgi:hypothetical protein